MHKGWALLLGAGVTTLVAGTAIAPFAVYHFHRMTHYGLVANLVAAPLVSLLIMPMAVGSLIAMPFGFEAWPLRAMGLGIELMVATGKWVASWPGAVSILPQISGVALVLIVLGGLWLCLWQTPARALGLVIAAVGLALVPQAQRPDVLIEREGATAALRLRVAISSSRRRRLPATSSTIGSSPTATNETPPRHRIKAPSAATL